MPRKYGIYSEYLTDSDGFPKPMEMVDLIFISQEDADKFRNLLDADTFQSMKQLEEMYDIYPSDMWYDSFKERLHAVSPKSIDRLNNGEKLNAVIPKNMALSNEVIEFIKENLPKDSTILEFGSGRGTEILSKTFNMLSVEENLDWVDRYDSEYLHAEIKEDWYDIEKVNNFIKDKSYDLVLIDGPADGDRNKIAELISNGKLKVNTNVSFLIDDAEREGGADLMAYFCKILNRDGDVLIYKDVLNKKHAFAYFEEIEND